MYIPLLYHLKIIFDFDALVFNNSIEIHLRGDNSPFSYINKKKHAIKHGHISFLYRTIKIQQTRRIFCFYTSQAHKSCNLSSEREQCQFIPQNHFFQLEIVEVVIGFNIFEIVKMSKFNEEQEERACSEEMIQAFRWFSNLSLHCRNKVS